MHAGSCCKCILPDFNWVPIALLIVQNAPLAIPLGSQMVAFVFLLGIFQRIAFTDDTAGFPTGLAKVLPLPSAGRGGRGVRGRGFCGSGQGLPRSPESPPGTHTAKSGTSPARRSDQNLDAAWARAKTRPTPRRIRNRCAVDRRCRIKPFAQIDLSHSEECGCYHEQHPHPLETVSGVSAGHPPWPSRLAKI